MRLQRREIELMPSCARLGYEFVNTLFTDEWYSDNAMEKRGAGAALNTISL